MKKYSLIIPLFNEKDSLPLLIEKIKNLPNNIEPLIINDGSDDGSEEFMIDRDKIKFIQNDKNRGKGFSIIKGIKLSKEENIILMDGDHEIDLEEIPSILKIFEQSNSGVIIGKRWNENKIMNINNINDFGNYVINSLFNLMYSTNFNDILCCLKVIKKDRIVNLKLISNGFEIESEIMSKLALGNDSIKEIFINYKRRGKEDGKKLKLFHAWKIIWTIVNIKVKSFRKAKKEY